MPCGSGHGRIESLKFLSEFVVGGLSKVKQTKRLENGKGG